MLFNSFSFLLCFLPVTLIVYFLAARRAPDLAIAWLALASLFFYGWWDVRYVPLLLASVLVNYGSSLCIRHRQGRARQLWLTAAVTFICKATQRCHVRDTLNRTEQHSIGGFP